jgi:hypothetical protein
MVHSSPCEASSRSAGQEIPRLLCNPKVHYRVHKNPPRIPLLSQINPLRTLTSYFSTIHFKIILLPTLCLTSRLFFPLSGFLTKVLSQRRAYYKCYPSHPPWYIYYNNMWWNIQIVKCLGMQFFSILLLLLLRSLNFTLHNYPLISYNSK